MKRPRAELPKPSAEQQRVIDHVKRGHCINIQAVPGAGKTTSAMMIARAVKCGVNIITYNNQLAAECNTKIHELGMSPRVRASTFHSLCGKAADLLITNDTELLAQVESWERGDTVPDPMTCGLLILDEAQDMCRLLYRAICCLMRRREHHSLQIIVSGDTDQLLYNFSSYAEEAASPKYLEQSSSYFAEFSPGRTWVSAEFTVSYRLSPAIAKVCNLYWQRTIVGGNPVSQAVDFVYSSPYSKDVTDLISTAIAEDGAENVLLLSQTIRSSSPMGVQINRLLKRGFKFHLKGSGNNNSTPTTNKTRAWTFCSSKGVEADTVIILGISLHSTQRIAPLNQVCVGMSRARKKLLIVHGCSATDELYPIKADPLRVEETRQGLNLLQQEGDLYGVIPPLPKEPLDQVRAYTCPVTELCRVPANKLRDLIAELVEVTKVVEPSKNIQFETTVRFKNIVEDVSSLYGNAIPMALQAERGIHPPAMENMLNGVYVGMKTEFMRADFLRILRNELVALSNAQEQQIVDEFHGVKSSEEVCDIANRLGLVRNNRPLVFFPQRPDNDFTPYMQEVRDVYEDPSEKQPHIWLYLANAEAAFRRIHDKFVHIGAQGAESYMHWAESSKFKKALAILRQAVPEGGTYEADLAVPINKTDSRGDMVTEVSGRVDYLKDNHIMEFKATNELCDEHFMQTILYVCMLSVIKKQRCTGTIINCRTGESRSYAMEPDKANALIDSLVALTFEN